MQPNIRIEDKKSASWDRLPAQSAMASVLGSVLFFVFAYALVQFYWYVPSWLHYLDVGEIGILLAYMSSYALIESLVVFALLLAVGVVIGRSIRANFSTFGFVTVLILSLGAIAVHDNLNQYLDPLGWSEFLLYVLVAAVALVAIIAALLYFLWSRLGRLNDLVGRLADRMAVFQYIYIPAGLLGLVVLVIRNI